MNKKETIEYMLEELETPNRELTEWEDTFLGSIRRQFKEKKMLSDRQTEILERIYAEKTA